MKGGSKEYWFVLTAESLSWYKDEEVRGVVHSIMFTTEMQEDGDLIEISGVSCQKSSSCRCVSQLCITNVQTTVQLESDEQVV